MDPTLPVILAGCAGGAVIAWALLRAPRWSPSGSLASAPSRGTNGGRRDVINISAIRVAGVGGLGLVVMAVGLAWTFPSVGRALTLGAGLGVVLAVALIAYRRRVGPLPTSASEPGANTTLRLE